MFLALSSNLKELVDTKNLFCLPGTALRRLCPFSQISAFQSNLLSLTGDTMACLWNEVHKASANSFNLKIFKWDGSRFFDINEDMNCLGT